MPQPQPQAETETTMSIPPNLTTTLSPPSPPSPPLPPTAHLDRVFYLFGHPISQALSPLMHSTVYNALSLNHTMYLYETPSLASCLTLIRTPKSKFSGAAVTMPHKVSIIPHLDHLTPEAVAIGAVNTIFFQDSPTDPNRKLLCGTNTDCIGIREAIVQNISKAEVESMKGGIGMVIGGGGTSRAAIYTLKHFLGCSTIYIINRSSIAVEKVIEECTSKGFGSGLKYISSIQEAESLPPPTVCVSAIPDREPGNEQELKTRRIIEILFRRGKGSVLEMCYAPRPDTAVAKTARREGWTVIEGWEAIIWQGLEQDGIWLGREVSSLPTEKVKEVIRKKILGARL